MVSAEHHWDVAAQTDHVKWKGKDVTVNLADPAADEDGKAAYARWVNDSYWLIAPLKLKDRGVHVAQEASKTMDGAECEVLRLSFGQVGLTPNDQYRLYINPATKLVASWDYMPEPGKSMHGTWDGLPKVRRSDAGDGPQDGWRCADPDSEFEGDDREIGWLRLLSSRSAGGRSGISQITGAKS